MIKRFLLLGLIISLAILVIGCTPTPKANLTVLSLDPPDVNCGIVGASVLCTTTVTFTVANIGTVDAGPFKVLVRADPGLAQQGTLNVSGLAAGATTTLTIPLPPGGNCFNPDCTICITVDSDNEVIESNEGDNYSCETTIG
ncbi:MAG: CARDB domain-containing protein [Atribacterota bacterium]|jgi:subtilase family serine protease